MRRLGTRMVIAVLALALGGPLHGQGNRWERRVSDQLQRTAAALRGNSVGRPDLTRVRPLNGEESEAFPVTLQAGVAYAVMGVCDEDCTNLHLVLANAAGSEVAADRSSENFPVLQLTPQVTMQYRVKVVMAACQMNPCWYGVAVYRK